MRPKICVELRSRSKNNTEKSRSRPLISHHLTTWSDNMVTIYHQDTIAGQDNDHLHLTDSHFSQDDQRCDNSSSLSHDTGSFSLSNTISSVDLTTWGPDVRCHIQGGRSMGSNDTAAVVTARRGLARASQVWQDGMHDRTFNVLAPHLSATEGSESLCQMGKLHEMPVKTLDGEAQLLEGGEGSTRESFGEGGNGQKDERTEAQGFSICSKTASATSPSSHSRTDERSADKRSTEQDRVRTWTCITNSHGSSEQQHQRSPREGAQGTGTASRVPATHVGAAITHLRTALIAHWIWTRYRMAQMRQDFQRTNGQGHQNFPSRHYQKEKC